MLLFGVGQMTDILHLRHGGLAYATNYHVASH